MADVPIFLSIAKISEQIKTGEISPVELVEQLLARIEQLNIKLNTFVTIDFDRVKQAAKKAEKEIRVGKYRGPLHGIPIGIKDLIDTAGIVTTYGSAIYRNNIPNKDAMVVKRLKRAGAIPFFKTNTHEFALGITTNNLHFGPTRNPWNFDLIPGGSSGGSAAATAAHLCFAALGSDTGGSIRIPAAFCGLVGLKPTYGRVSLQGVFPLATSLDHVGPITKTVEDAAILLQVLAGFDEDDPRSLMAPVPNYRDGFADATIEGVQFAISKDLNPTPLDSEVERAFKTAISKIERLGGEILDVRLASANMIEDASSTILLAEAAVQHTELLAKYSDRYGANVIERFRAGQNIRIDEYIRAIRTREVILRECETLFQKVDFLMSPPTQIRPSKIGEKTVIINSTKINVISGCTHFTRLGNITGIPTIVLPCGYSNDNLPLSIQFMAPKLGEPALLKMAYAFEKATPELRNKSPPL
ncbi:MAG: amidase [Candidatus Heimdallarchaeota archaeon]